MSETENTGKQKAWVIALPDGPHWRFISVPNYSLDQNVNSCDSFSEYVVQISFDGPDSNHPIPAPTKREREIQWLRCDIETLERFLEELPEDHVIERLGFESKKKEEVKRLAILTQKETP